MSSNADTGVLTERLNNLLNHYESLQNAVEKQANAVSKIVELQADVRLMNNNTERLFSILNSHSDKIADHSQKISTHSTIWKICSAVLLASTGLFTYAYTTIQTLKDADNSADRRIITLEYEIHQVENNFHEVSRKN